MNNIWYKTIRGITNIGLFFYFKKIEVFGRENIPKQASILFVANHRNGLIDPIIVANTSGRIHYFLTRASAFKNRIADFWLRSINMLPIYRIRDGVDTLGKNQKIFGICYQVLSKKLTVVIFPEGNHGFPRRLRPLSKGFTRIAFGFLEKYPDQKLYVVPVGLNYTDTLLPFQSASVYFGKPIVVNDYFPAENFNDAIELLKTKTAEALKEISIHIASEENYNAIEYQLLTEGFDFLNPSETNTRIAQITTIQEVLNPFDSRKYTLLEQIVIKLFKINSTIPYLIWQKKKSKVKDIVMLSTFKYGLGILLLPMAYFMQSVLVSWFWGWKAGITYLIFSFLLVYFRKKMG